VRKISSFYADLRRIATMQQAIIAMQEGCAMDTGPTFDSVICAKGEDSAAEHLPGILTKHAGCLAHQDAMMQAGRHICCKIPSSVVQGYTPVKEKEIKCAPVRQAKSLLAGFENRPVEFRVTKMNCSAHYGGKVGQDFLADSLTTPVGVCTISFPARQQQPELAQKRQAIIIDAVF
jgi:hypothetical protein